MISHKHFERLLRQLTKEVVMKAFNKPSGCSAETYVKYILAFDTWSFALFAYQRGESKYPREEANALHSTWKKCVMEDDKMIAGCAICGDTRENPDGWECMGCGTV
jgi:hypothetical protein